MRKLPAILLAAAIALGLVAFGARRTDRQARSDLHAEIAAIRSHQESFALRNGHYLLVPDSCASAGDDQAWRHLGRARPSTEIGCFRVEAHAPSYTDGATATAALIIGENERIDLRGVEATEASAPQWSRISTP